MSEEAEVVLQETKEVAIEMLRGVVVAVVDVAVQALEVDWFGNVDVVLGVFLLGGKIVEVMRKRATLFI